MNKQEMMKMMDKEPKNYDGLFENPAVVEIFLYCVQKPEGVSIREAQRDLGINSTSSIHWQLAKLMDADLVSQDENKIYKLTESGRNINTVNLPVNQKFLVFRGTLYPVTVFHLSFMISSIIFGAIIMTGNMTAAAIYMLSALLVLAIDQFISIRKSTKKDVSRSN